MLFAPKPKQSREQRVESSGPNTNNQSTMVQVSSRQNKTAQDSTPTSKQDKIQWKSKQVYAVGPGYFLFTHNQEETKKSNPYGTQNIVKSKRTRDTPPTRKIKNRTKKILKHIENFRPRDGKSKENGQVQERRSKSCPVGNPADQPHPEITGIKNRELKKADREGFKTKGAPAIQLPVPQQCSSVKNMVKWR